jgi:serine/threonine protein kinase
MGARDVDAERHNAQQRLLVKLATSEPMRRGDFPLAAKLITEASARAMDVGRVSVWLYDPGRTKIECVDLFEKGSHSSGLALEVKDYPSYFRAMTSDRILAADDARTDPRTREFRESYLEPLGITSLMDAPIRRRGELVGMICHEQTDAVRSWSFDEQMFAASLADLIAIVMEAGADAPPPSANVHETTGTRVLADLTGEHDFGKYTLLEMLGEGGMAEIYLAVARGPRGADKLNVIKRLKRPMASDPTTAAMFLDEGRIATRLDHPNVVHTCEVGSWRRACFLVMEYLEGQPLNRVFDAAMKRHEPIDVGIWVLVIAEALAGLQHVHDLRDFDGRPLGLVHRDISPHNLFVTYGGVVKVVDFGIAKSGLNAVRTETGVIKGKLGYMAPEQASQGAVDHRADIYATGVVLWELLTGQHLRRGRSARVLFKMIEAEVPTVTSVNPHVDRELSQVVARALAADRDDRWQSAQAMRTALLDYAEAKGHVRREEDVAQLIGSLFSERRDDMRRRVEEHLVRLSIDA